MNKATLPLKTSTPAKRFAKRPITISRVPHDTNYTVIANHLINDPLLDWKDVGLLTFLLSKPDNWEINVRHLSGLRKTGRDGIYSGLASLENAGYLKRKPNPKGGWDYQISEVPFWQLPSTPVSHPIPTPPIEQPPIPVIESEIILDSMPSVDSMPLPAFPYTDIPLTENPIQLNTDFLPNTEKNSNTAPQPLPEIKPTLEPVVVETLEKIFSGAQLNQSKTYLAEISTVFQLQVLTTILLKMSKEPIDNKIGYLRRLITSVKNGTFTPPPVAVKPISSEEIMRREKLKQAEAKKRAEVDNVSYFADLYKKLKGNFEIPEQYKQAVFERLGLAYG